MNDTTNGTTEGKGNNKRVVETHEIICKDLWDAFCIEEHSIENLTPYCMNTGREIGTEFEIGRNTVSVIIKIKQ